jgi:hypothetical protein
MAAGLGFKDFVTGEVLTANDVDGYLMQGIWVFANAAARTAAVTSPQEGNYSYLKDTNSTEYYDGSAWVASGGGSSGKVKQVVSSTTTTATTIASTSDTDTTITATITPTSATSTILVLVTYSLLMSRNTTSQQVGGQLLRGATVILEYGDFALVGLVAANPMELRASGAISKVDSPATTSATTYKFQSNVNGTTSSGQVIFQPSSTPSTITLIEIGA